jgi:hypothetical protein
MNGHFKRTRQALIAVSLIAAAALAGYGYFLSTIITVNRELAELTENLGQEALRETHIRSVRNLLRDTETERIRVRSQFIGENDVVPFIEQIEGLAEASGVQLDIRSVAVVDAGERDANHEWLSLSLSALGSWSNVQHFLALVEHFPATLVVGQLRLGRQASEEGGVAWDLSMTFNAVKESEIDTKIDADTE